jgi:hypothetical protein
VSDKHYRCYFIRDDHVVAVEQLDCADDASALLRASTILNASEFLSIELWREARLIGHLSRQPSGLAEHKQAS